MGRTQLLPNSFLNMGISISKRLLPRLLLLPGLLLVALVVVVTTAQAETGGSTTTRLLLHYDDADERLLQQGGLPAPSPTNPFNIPLPPSSRTSSQNGGAVVQPALTPEQIDTMVTYCNMDYICYHGATCVDGAPNFDDHVLPGGTVLPIHKVNEIMNEHCQCSSDAWTGLQCNIPVAVCDTDGSSRHYC